MSAFTVRNTTAETIPPYAAMRLVGRGYIDTRPDGTTSTVQAFLVDKPNADSMDTVVFNGPSPIMPGRNGQACNIFPCPAALGAVAQLPVAGDVWGTREGEWALFQGNTGFSIVQIDLNGVAIVMRSALGVGGFDQAISITTGTLLDGAYDAILMIRDDVSLEWIEGDPKWVLDLAGSLSLKAGAQYPGLIVRDLNDEPVQEPYGPYFLSLVNANLDNALTDTGRWSLILSLTPTTWISGSYPYGSYVSDGGHNYCNVNHAGTSGVPGASSDWLQADVLTEAGGHRSSVAYAYDPIAGADYVQEMRGVLAIRSEASIVDDFFTFLAGGVLETGAMTMSAKGFYGNPLRLGTGSPSLGAMTMAGTGYTGVFVGMGRGDLTLGAMTMDAIGYAVSFLSSFTARLDYASYVGGRWVYKWIEQVADPVTGDSEDAVPGRSGDTLVGPFMREVNNHLVLTPSYAHIRLRGIVNNQPMYDFDRCCALADAILYGSGNLLLGAMTMAGSGTFNHPTFTGKGSPSLGAMFMMGVGFVGSTPMFLGSGAPLTGAMTMAGGATYVSGSPLELGTPGTYYFTAPNNYDGVSSTLFVRMRGSGGNGAAPGHGSGGGGGGGGFDLIASLYVPVGTVLTLVVAAAGSGADTGIANYSIYCGGGLNGTGPIGGAGGLFGTPSIPPGVQWIGQDGISGSDGADASGAAGGDGGSAGYADGLSSGGAGALAGGGGGGGDGVVGEAAPGHDAVGSTPGAGLDGWIQLQW